ncbi:hypothetical protein SDC9_37292 [bioreactor metagenome]|uniref:Uncharacterized protein n=1 Tax=bioreactor metagenome TaxID=1076179 RepID=A0A644VIT8_9ZZZZ|nr:hypothetical protein [Negativicutes bacterium]
MMRLRRNRIRQLTKVSHDDLSGTPKNESINEKETNKVKKSLDSSNIGFFRKIITNPNFTFQLMVIILTLASDNVRMDRRIDTMTTKIDAIRGITDVINNTMQSVRVASEAPKHIRKLLQ